MQLQAFVCSKAEKARKHKYADAQNTLARLPPSKNMPVSQQANAFPQALSFLYIFLFFKIAYWL